MLSRAVLATCVAISMVACVSAFTTPVLGRLPMAAKAVSMSPARPARMAVSSLRMSEGSEAATTDVSELPKSGGVYFGVDAEGNKVELTLKDAEKRYLDACNAFYNDKKTIMSDDEFDQLREDLSFQGSSVTLMSRMEVMFMVAANRYAEGKPIMSDDEFDALRRKLKARNSAAVMHKVPSCRVDSQTCKADLTVDDGKNWALYFPIAPLITLVWLEASFLLTGEGFGPSLNLLLNLPFIAVFSYIFKQFILYQNPLVVKTACPQCYTEQNIYFGDILWCRGSDSPILKTECVNKACGCELRAYRERMVVETDLPKSGKAPEPAVPV